MDAPPGRPYWDAIAEEDDSLPAGWRRHARDAHLALLRGWVGETRGRWLKTDLFEELGGERPLLPHLTGEWVGMDVGHAIAARAGHVQRRPVVQCDVRRLPFADAAFDGVLSTSTLDHFDDAADIDVALAELRRVLRPDGRLVLTLDNPANPLIALRNALPPRLARRTGLAPFHVGPTLDERAGRAALERAGFDVLATAHLLHAPHVVGTRLARFARWERRALPAFDRLAGTRVARFSGHFVAFLAAPTPLP